MCTQSVIHGVSWWSIWIVIGIILCLLTFDQLCRKKGVTAAANKFYYILGIVSIVLGFGAASLVQSVYNFIETKEWSWGGVTFMGGLYGGMITFVLGALLLAKGKVRSQFGLVANVAAPCIPVAHAFGRIGCFAVGCCYGAEVKEGDFFSAFGIMMHQHNGAGEIIKSVNRYPTQLFEAIFLLILAGVLIYFAIKDKKINVIVYLVSYAVFRFLLEFLRADERGSIGTSALSPSQVLSIVSIIVAVALIVIKLLAKYKPEAAGKVMRFFRLDDESCGITEISAQASAEQSAETEGCTEEKNNKNKPD